MTVPDNPNDRGFEVPDFQRILIFRIFSNHFSDEVFNPVEPDGEERSAMISKSE